MSKNIFEWSADNKHMTVETGIIPSQVNPSKVTNLKKITKKQFKKYGFKHF